MLTNSAGSTVSNAATLNVTALPACLTAPSIGTPPASVTVTAPAAASFTAAGSTPPGCSAPTVQWQLSTDGGATFTDIAGATSATYSTGATSTTQSGNEYRAVFTNGAGSADSTAATLTVISPSAPVVTSVTPNSGFVFSLVVIRGRNLNGARGVSFGSHRTLFVPLGSRLVIALAPPAPAGTVDVTVRTRQGTSEISSADRFTYRN